MSNSCVQAKKTVELDPGLYDLQLQSMYRHNDTGGVFKLSMKCPQQKKGEKGNFAESKDDADPGGFSVDPRTGVITAYPNTTSRIHDRSVFVF